jgi:hypothetical protein
MNPPLDETHGIVSQRLKFVDALVKAGRIGDAINEIAGIKQIDPAILTLSPMKNAYRQ